MRELGLEANIVLNKDGSFEMDIFGVTASGTWTDKGGGTIELSMYGDEMDMTLSGNELILVDDKDQYVFVRKS
jgi:hypothetical protein